MHIQTVVARDNGELTPVLRENMFRLRHRTFRERLKWELPEGGEAGIERDQYDGADPVYVVVAGEGEEVFGCCRLLPTMGSYMLPELWPELLDGQAAPASQSVWELSRFAVEPPGGGLAQAGRLTARLMLGAFRYAASRGIEQYVVVTGTAMERLLGRMGVVIHRFGKPVQIGGAPVVAGTINIDDETEEGILSALEPGLGRRRPLAPASLTASRTGEAPRPSQWLASGLTPPASPSRCPHGI